MCAVFLSAIYVRETQPGNSGSSLAVSAFPHISLFLFCATNMPPPNRKRLLLNVLRRGSWELSYVLRPGRLPWMFTRTFGFRHVNIVKLSRPLWRNWLAKADDAAFSRRKQLLRLSPHRVTGSECAFTWFRFRFMQMNRKYFKLLYRLDLLCMHLNLVYLKGSWSEKGISHHWDISYNLQFLWNISTS